MVWRYVGGLNAVALLHLPISSGFGWTNKAERKLLSSSFVNLSATVQADVFQIPPQTPSLVPLCAILTGQSKMQKRLIGRYFTFKFSGRKSDISGVVLAYNEKYTLIRAVVDYTPNGYTIFKNEKVEHYFGDHEKIATKILKLKNYSSDEEPNIPIDTLDNIFSFISDYHQLIQLDTRKETLPTWFGTWAKTGNFIFLTN